MGHQKPHWRHSKRGLPFEAGRGKWRLVQRTKYGLVWEKNGKELTIYDLGARLGTEPSGYWVGHMNGKELFRNSKDMRGYSTNKARAIKTAKRFMR